MAPRLIAVVGPTASGKSALGLELARELDGEIVSCDSLQVYRGLDIGSAKPTVAERTAVPHHLIDVRDPDGDFSAADYARLAAAAIEGIRGRGRVPLIVGGTGLYLRALTHGLFEGPSRRPDLRGRFEALADRYGDPRLHRLLARVDGEAAARVGSRDRIRMVRALEVYWATGRPISDQQRSGTRPLAGLEILILGLSPERDDLRRRVEARTAAMRAAGLLDEVRGLLARYPPTLRPLQAIGYRQAVAMVRGELSEEEGFPRIVTETLRYAKRQRTWFRHQANVAWQRDAASATQTALDWIRGRRDMVRE